MIVGMFR